LPSRSWLLSSCQISEIEMPVDRNVSPVGWYIGGYLLRFIEVADPSRDDEEEKFLTWENTVIVKAENLDEAYDKVASIGRQSTAPYKGGPAGIDVKWEFEGVTFLVPIYAELEDGAEVLWAEHAPRKLRNIKRMVAPKGSFHQRRSDA
jgi:hypothetical protein